MTDRERIDGLLKIAGFFEARADMAVGDAKMLLLNWMKCAQEAAEALKKQTPKVLALDDIQSFDGAVLVEYTGTFGNPMFEWLLYQVQHNQYVMFSNHNRSNIVFDANDYGKGWRCWTSHPTDEQREITPWTD